MKLKRIMAIVLCFAMVLSTMSFNVFAEDATDYSDVISSVESEVVHDDLTLNVKFNGIEKVDSYNDWWMNVFFTANKDLTLACDNSSADGYLAVSHPVYDMYFGGRTDFPKSGTTIEYKAGEKIKILDHYWAALGMNFTQKYKDMFTNTMNGVAAGIKLLEDDPDLYGEISLEIYEIVENQDVNHITLASYSFGEKPGTDDDTPAEGAVAKIGDIEYDSLQEAIDAAKSLTGDVTVEILGKVSLKTSIGGSFDSIKFVGKNDNAEIYMDIQGYIEAPGKKVAFEDLKLSKVAGGYVANAGFMNLAFGIYAAKSVSYEDCVFLNGAYSSGDTTFEGCTFYSSHDRYGLWVYGDTSCVVDECIFDDIRGIKVYHEGKLKTADLTVKNTEFTEKVNGKPAIVLTNGKSVTLENNTYSSTGVFELDLDGNPNGTVIVSDVDPICVNDNGDCGVIVDGKIYTTVADAADVAVSGSTVTLLHDSDETVEFAKGVTLDKNGYTADGVTVETPVAKIGNVEYKTIEAAIQAAQVGDTVTILEGTYAVPSEMKAGITIEGEGTVILQGTLSGTLENLTLKNLHIKGGNAQRWAYAKGDLVFENVTFEATSVYALHFDGITEGAKLLYKDCTIIGWAAMGGSPESCVFDGCTFKDNGKYGLIRTFFDSEIKNCTFDVNGADQTDAYQDGIHAAGSTIKVYNCTNENGELMDIINATSSEAGDRAYVYVDDNLALVSSVAVKVSTKDELNEAIKNASDKDTITLTADIDYGSEQLKLDKPIILDLGGKTLTTSNAWGGMSVKNNPTIKNGTIVHASNTAAIKVWNATAFEDLVIDVQGKGDANKTIGGIVLQSGTTTRVDSMKNVTIRGVALTNGIETYNCGDATEDVIGSMENVSIDALGTGMLISAPCGTATNCEINGGKNGIEIWIKGNYSAKLDLVDCDVVGGVYAHDEFNSNPGIQNIGTISLTADANSTGADEDDITLTIARAENVEGVLETVMNNSQAKVGDTYYPTFAVAIAAANDGDEIEVISDVVIDENTRTHNSGEWYDGIYYIGDKSFTVDLNGFTIKHDGSVNDYLLNFKNDGTKANKITIKNGTIDAGTNAFCAICTSSTSKQQITINLEDVTLINNVSNGSTAKIRGGAVLNVKKGTVIKGLNSYLGIECVASTVNIYDGAEIYQNGTSSDLGGLVGACGNGVVNVYGGYGKSAKCGFVAMTSGGTINVHGGEWISNTDGSIGDNSNFYVLTSQNNAYESGYTGASVINVTGGTFFGGMDAWILNAGLNEVAELNITGGIFNTNPQTYVEAGYEGKKADSLWKVVKSATSATVKAHSETSTVKAGDKVTVQVIAEGFDFTNGDWELRYDPTMFELDAAATTYYKDTTKGVEAQSVNSADENTLAGKVIAVGGSLKQGNEIPSGTVLATYTFTVLPQSKDTVTGKFDIVNAHINTYDYAISQTNVPAIPVDFDITITRAGKVITGSLEVATPTYNGDIQKGNAFVISDTVVGKENAVITYSETENGIYTTELPTYKKAGSYSIWVKVSVDGYAEYKAEHEYMVIGAKDIALSLEVAAGAAYNKVNVKPVITGVYDTEFEGTLTVTGVEGTYTKDDFIYMGNHIAVAKETRPMSVNAGDNEITITYTKATVDNYADSTETTTVNADKAFATQAIVDDLNAAADAAVTDIYYNGTEHTVMDKIVVPDGWSVAVTRISDGTTNPGVTEVADKEFIEIRFTHANYNDVVVSRVLKVEPLNLTITVPDFEKGAGEADDFTTKSVTYTSKFVASAAFATIDDLVATAGLNVSIVRKTLGEADGNYDITAAYTPNDNYVITVDDGKLTIGMPSDTKIEVVNNTLNGNGNSSADYVAGYKLVLVYTNTATARYTYDDKEMFDLSNAGYEYFDNTKSIADQTDDNYKYVYGIIVKAEGTAEDAYYADKVDFIGTNKYKPEKIVYDADINYDDKFSPNDISAANGVLNVENELDAFFMYYFLKADYDRTADGEYKSDKMVKLFDVQEVQKFINTKTTIQ